MMAGLLLALLPCILAKDDGPLVSLPLGSLRGVAGVTERGTEHAKFTRVPFAEPPVGQLRFEEPEAKGPWEGEWDATQAAPSCPQVTQYQGPPTQKGVEDCLYLNIYTPALSSSPKPVMVWIHGGGFKEGDASDFTDPEFLIDEDVVFVAIQYRLGVLGFLALGTPEVPGNLGIKDQQEALRWVQRNIAHFGGNPEKVTIFGESAGGVSVHSHVLSPASANLFRAAIMQSGTALMTYERTIRRGAERESRRVVEELGCGEEENPLPCLRRLEVANLTDPGLKDNLWVVQDNTSPRPVLPFNPLQQLMAGMFHRVPVMNGITLHDGAVIYAVEEVLRAAFGGYLSFAETALGVSVEESSTERLLVSHYLGRSREGSFEENEEGITNLHTDALFASPGQQVGEYHSKVAPYYSYILASRCNDLSIGVFYGLEDISPDYVAHADDLPCIFKPDGVYFGAMNEDQAKTSRAMVKAWTDFAKDLKPGWPAGERAMVFQPESGLLSRAMGEEEPYRGMKDRLELWEALYWAEKRKELPDLTRRRLMEALGAWTMAE